MPLHTLERKIDDQISRATHTLAGGGCSDMIEYRAITSEIHTLRRVKDWIRDMIREEDSLGDEA